MKMAETENEVLLLKEARKKLDKLRKSQTKMTNSYLVAFEAYKIVDSMIPVKKDLITKEKNND